MQVVALLPKLVRAVVARDFDLYRTVTPDKILDTSPQHCVAHS